MSSNDALRRLVALALASAPACGSTPAPPPTPKVPPGRVQLAQVRMTCRESDSPRESACPEAVVATASEASRRLRAALRERPVDCPDDLGEHVLHLLWDADQGAVVSTDFAFSPDGVDVPDCLGAAFVGLATDTLTELWVPHVRPHADLSITWNVVVRAQ